MFTGIIEEVGTIKSSQRGRLAISATKVLAGTNLGDSIAVNGVCLTVTDLNDGSFSVEVMPETLRCTNLGMLNAGDAVNLERAIAVDGRFGGHFVQGHVDGTGRVLALAPEGGAIIMRVAAPSEIMRYLIHKGFVALDGISLTTIECSATSFSVSLVTHTRQQTTLGKKQPGDMVNLEIDIISKYVEQFTSRDKSGITIEFLSEHGFH